MHNGRTLFLWYLIFIMVTVLLAPITCSDNIASNKENTYLLHKASPVSSICSLTGSGSSNVSLGLNKILSYAVYREITMGITVANLSMCISIRLLVPIYTMENMGVYLTAVKSLYNYSVSRNNSFMDIKLYRRLHNFINVYTMDTSDYRPYWERFSQYYLNILYMVPDDLYHVVTNYSFDKITVFFEFPHNIPNDLYENVIKNVKEINHGSISVYKIDNHTLVIETHNRVYDKILISPRLFYSLIETPILFAFSPFPFAVVYRPGTQGVLELQFYGVKGVSYSVEEIKVELQIPRVLEVVSIDVIEENAVTLKYRLDKEHNVIHINALVNSSRVMISSQNIPDIDIQIRFKVRFYGSGCFDKGVVQYTIVSSSNVFYKKYFFPINIMGESNCIVAEPSFIENNPPSPDIFFIITTITIGLLAAISIVYIHRRG